ncbi:PREDICTED: uncharacterized protein LOC109236237, partial [Nicotiana attenuata]|uniref:uncharacterized protein LOC109236237 n=1 Tax=Nicotiana attenuata TaxID=49451 RepID=UPI0009048263
KEVIKWLDAGVVYPISDSSWTSPVQCVPKKGGMTVVTNANNELIPTRTVTGWRVCMDYRKLNKVTRKDHFPLPFLDQMLDRLAGRAFYCFLDGYSGYNQILIAPEDQEKTTFTCPYGTFAFSRMPFGLCNAPATFQRCMMAIFTDMVEDILEVFMDDFSVVGDSFDECLKNLDRVLARCEDTNLVLNWEKCHFMVEEGIVLGHKISKNGIEVDKSKIEVISRLPPPTSVKGVRSFLGHAGFYRRFIKDLSTMVKQQGSAKGGGEYSTSPTASLSGEGTVGAEEEVGGARDVGEGGEPQVGGVDRTRKPEAWQDRFVSELSTLTTTVEAQSAPPPPQVRQSIEDAIKEILANQQKILDTQKMLTEADQLPLDLLLQDPIPATHSQSEKSQRPPKRMRIIPRADDAVIQCRSSLRCAVVAREESFSPLVSEIQVSEQLAVRSSSQGAVLQSTRFRGSPAGVRRPGISFIPFLPCFPCTETEFYPLFQTLLPLSFINRSISIACSSIIQIV